MCVTTLTCPRVIRGRRVLIIGLIAILVFASLALITAAILEIWSLHARDGYEADLIPVVQNLVIPVPPPAAAEIKTVTAQVSTPSSVGLLEPSVVPVPVPTPPL